MAAIVIFLCGVGAEDLIDGDGVDDSAVIRPGVPVDEADPHETVDQSGWVCIRLIQE